MEKKYHYFYKITNTKTGKYYYGIHSTSNLNDGYMGSGTHLKMDYEIYGKDAFVKEIIKFFDTREEASKFEANVVNEDLVFDKDCYNIKIGGDYGVTTNTLLVADKNGRYHRCTRDDPRYISGEWKHFCTGMSTMINKETGEKEWVSAEIYRNNKDKYASIFSNMVPVIDENGVCKHVRVDCEDILTEKVKYLWDGRKHTEETKEKQRKTFAEIHHQQGEKNSHYGTVWVYKDKETKCIKKEDEGLYINNGWKKGRFFEKGTFDTPSDSIIDKNELIKMRENNMSWSEIAKHYGVGENTLIRYRKRHGLL